MEPTLIIGSVVQLVGHPGQDPFAAVVTKVWGGPAQAINCRALTDDGHNPAHLTSVPRAGKASEGYVGQAWRWPVADAPAPAASSSK